MGATRILEHVIRNLQPVARYDEEIQPRSNDICPDSGSRDSGADDLPIFLYILTGRQFFNLQFRIVLY